MSESATTAAVAIVDARRAPQWVRQAAAFLVVGGVGFVVNVVVFTLLRDTVFSPARIAAGPLLATVAATAISIAVNWLGNRLWAFRQQRRRERTWAEALQFVTASLVGTLASFACLAISHYGMDLTTTLDDNISANVVGLAIGTAIRFVLYRWWVFAPARTASV